MKLKYYMRGLGIGIILTTLLISIANPKEKLTDAEIIQRAEELGMVTQEESNSNLEKILNDTEPTGTASLISATPEPTMEPTATPEPTLIPTATPVPPTASPTLGPTPEPTVKPTEQPEQVQKVTPTAEPKPTVSSETKDNSESISFTITRGMTSGKVADMLVKVGLIKDADDFNHYIEGAGKASIIRVGKYTLPKNASYDEIIKAITTKQ